MLKVDFPQLKRKISSFNGLFTTLQRLHRDAAIYIQGRLVESILAGETGTNYPKSYPSSITEGVGGYVGVVSGQLRQSIQQKSTGKYSSRIFVDPTAAAIGAGPNSKYQTYAEFIADWSQEKYGRNFMQIAVELYGEYVTERISFEMNRLIKSLNSGTPYFYKNPF